VRVARLAAKDQPAIAGNFVLPDPGGPNKAFITAAKAMLATALEEQATLVGLGLGETFLADLTAAVAAYDGANAVAHTNHLDHVGAGADLHAVANECVKQAGIMDGLNRSRFANNPEMLAAWISASRVEGPFRFRGAAAVAEPEPVPVVSPPPIPNPVVPPLPVVALAATEPRQEVKKAS
jgi:hypothetical protein